MINDVLPTLISLALQRDTAGIQLKEDDLRILVEKGIAERWAGTGAVAYDNFPTMGPVFDKISGEEVQNARCTTHLGSGGVSFGPACVAVSNSHPDDEKSEVIIQARHFGYSGR